MMAWYGGLVDYLFLRIFALSTRWVPVTMGYSRLLYELGVCEWKCDSQGVDLQFLKPKFKNPGNFETFLRMGENIRWIRDGRLKKGVFHFLTGKQFGGFLPFANAMMLRQPYYLKEILVDSEFKAMRELYHSDKSCFYELAGETPEYLWWNRMINSVSHTGEWFRKCRFPKDALCLDIAGNHGENARIYLESNPTIKFHVLDLAHKATDAKAYLQQHGLENSIEFMPGDIFDLQTQHRYDVVTISHFLEMWSKPEVEQILRETKKVMNPNGRLYLLILGTEGKLRQRWLLDNFHLTYFNASTMGKTSFDSISENEAIFKRIGFETVSVEQLSDSFYGLELKMSQEATC